MAFCLPWWHTTLSQGPFTDKTVISSGCSVDSNGNVPCLPAALRAKAEAKMQALGLWPSDKSLPLDVYSLGRYATSEVGNASPEELVTVMEAAIHKAIQRHESPTQLLLTGDGVHYGPIHSTGLAHPFGRWAATSKDPTARSLLIAEFVLSGQAGNFSNSNSQYGLDVIMGTGRDPYAFIENIAQKDRAYWVGPLPGVNQFHTFAIRTLSRLEAALTGKRLIAQAKDWVKQGPPDWSGLDVCPRPRFPIGAVGSGGLIGLGVGLGVGVGLASLGRLRR